jgi:MoaE-MoaD fusion protein
MNLWGRGCRGVMQIRVLFFGALKDVVGRAEEHLQLEPGIDIARLFDLYLHRFPGLERHRASVLFSRNREFVDQGQSLEEGDEVAFLPPVSGGAPSGEGPSQLTLQEKLLCRLTTQPIDTRALVERARQDEDGAVVIFEGVVRNHSKGRATKFLEYEAYEPMALEKMREIGEELARRFPVDRIAMVHRLGRLEIGEASVVIVVGSEHRKAAFEACREAIDRLKRFVPIWKKEYFADGAVWVEGEGSGDTTGETQAQGPVLAPKRS